MEAERDSGHGFYLFLILRFHRQECLCHVGSLPQGRASTTAAVLYFFILPSAFYLFLILRFHRQECLCHIDSLPQGRASTSGRAAALFGKVFAFLDIRRSNLLLISPFPFYLLNFAFLRLGPAFVLPLSLLFHFAFCILPFLDSPLPQAGMPMPHWFLTAR